MHPHRTAPVRAPRRRTIAALAAVVAMLAITGSASAAAAPQVAPTPTAPAVGASGFVEGKSMDFAWQGDLQGDPDALGRSFFRVEIALASDVPAGVQSTWPTLETSRDTDLGEAAGTLTLGVPAAGTYRWRVCAWGVVDDVTANEVQQMPGGCSSSRTFTTTAAAAIKAPIGEMKMETKVAMPGRVVRVTQERAPEPVAPAPVVTPPDPVEPPVAAPVKEAPAPTLWQPLKSHGTSGTEGSALGLDREGLTADAASQRDGIGGAISGGLTSTLPLVPIPFWALALLLACFPIARLWRRDVLAMFDWADGSINGSGGFDDVLGDLPSVHRATDLKHRSTTADGDASALVTPESAPDRGRRAA
ncbi:MAG: hypothetical protein JWM98_335 [Thermoleophilia bacterium]|nr:hypothetical protein [Thermoleophilia bacterium]